MSGVLVRFRSHAKGAVSPPAAPPAAKLGEAQAPRVMEHASHVLQRDTAHRSGRHMAAFLRPLDEAASVTEAGQQVMYYGIEGSTMISLSEPSAALRARDRLEHRYERASKQAVGHGVRLDEPLEGYSIGERDHG